MAVFCTSLPSNLLVTLRFPVKDVLHDVWKINSARFSSVRACESASFSNAGVGGGDDDELKSCN